MDDTITTPWGATLPTAREVDDFIRAMKPGEHVVYHVGFLSRDRGEGATMDVALGELADRFYLHGTPGGFRYAHGREMDGRAVDGLSTGELSQVRLNNERYAYRFTKVGNAR